MTTLQVSTLFNALGATIILVLSCLAWDSHPRPFFRYWTYSYVWGVIMLGGEFLALYIGRPWWLSWLIITTVAAKTALMIETGRELLEILPLKRTIWLFLSVVCLAVGLVSYRGGDFKLLIIPFALAFALTYIWLGGVFFWLGRRNRYIGADLLGIPLILTGLLVLSYPVLERGPLFWLGYLSAAVLSLFVGTGMLLFLLKENVYQLQQQNERLIQLSDYKMKLLGMVSHELRTPLTSIVGYLEFMEEGVGGELSPQHRGYHLEITKSSQQLSQLIEALLDSQQLESGELRIQMDRVDVNLVVSETVASLGSLADKKGLHLAVRLSPAPAIARADALRLSQVLVNLVGNALKFTESGGLVEVETTTSPQEIRVSVRDTGEGIPDTAIGQIFDPFYQVDSTLTRRHGGTGLGLMITRHLVERMGGAIGVLSELGKGSTFWFTLQAEQEQRPIVGRGA